MPGDRRQQIIQTARRMFTSRPYDQVTTSEIAKDAGVAYGLIAHHFENKRGLYLAVTNEIATEIAEVHATPAPAEATPVEALRHALHNHIAYIDSHSDSFVALLRGALGADPEHQAAIDQLRWLGAQRILAALGIAEPVPAVLRTSMHGWVGYFDEMMIDRITHRDIEADALVELAAAALLTTLRIAAALDTSISFPAELHDAWQHSGEPWPSDR